MNLETELRSEGGLPALAVQTNVKYPSLSVQQHAAASLVFGTRRVVLTFDPRITRLSNCKHWFYDILPSAAARIGYVIDLRNGVQNGVTFVTTKTAQITSGRVSLITEHSAYYVTTYETKTFLNRDGRLAFVILLLLVSS